MDEKLQNPLNSKPTGEEIVIYESTVSPLRILSIFAFTFAIGSLFLAAHLLRKETALTSAITAAEYTAWAAGMVVVCCGFFVGVAFYMHRVAVKIGMLSGGRTLRVTTATLLGTAETHVLCDDLTISDYHTGDRRGEAAITPPRLWVRVRGGKSFYVSLTGNVPDPKLLMSVLHASG